MIASVVILVIFMSLATAVGFSIAFVGIWALSDTWSMMYYIRILMWGNADMVGMYFSLICPIIFGFCTIIPLSFTIALTQMSPLDERFRRVSKVLATILIIMAVAQVPLIIAPMAMTSTVTATNLLSGMIASMNSQYVGLPQSWSENRPNSLIWSKIMISQYCCGISGISDFTTNYVTRASIWYVSYRQFTMSNGTSVTGSAVRIPADCCVLTSQGILTSGDYSNIRSYLVNGNCPVNLQSTLASNGCYNAAYNYLVVYTGVVFAILLIMQVFEGFAIAASLHAAIAEDPNDCGGGQCGWLCEDCCQGPAKVTPVREYNQYNRYTDGFSNQPTLTTYSNRMNGLYYNTK